MGKRKAKVSRAFLKEDPLKKTETGEEVIGGFTDHPLVFVTPIPSIADLTGVNDTLREKVIAALNGDKEAIEKRDAAEKVWDEKFSKSASYVDGVADGDTLIIEQSGFKSTKTETTKKVKPGQPVIKTAKGDYTTKGKVDIECLTLAGADFYIAVASQQLINMNIKNSQALFAPQAEMGISISTTRKISIEGLQSKQEYQVTVMCFNTAGLGPQSQVATVVVP